MNDDDLKDSFRMLESGMAELRVELDKLRHFLNADVVTKEEIQGLVEIIHSRSEEITN